MDKEKETQIKNDLAYYLDAIFLDYMRALGRKCLSENSNEVKVFIPMGNGNELIAHIEFDANEAEEQQGEKS